MDKFKTVKKEEIYSDFFVNLTVHPETKEIIRLTNEDAVKRSIKNIVLTDTYERPYSKLGGGVRALLFELNTPQTRETIKEKIRNSIENYEKRAKLIDITVDTSADEKSYIISIFFYVVNRTDPVEMRLTLDRVR